ncbi:MAG: bifunctional pyr operon transcriptional regulator/uracil phosphoribosyltransferase PyrR, partial [Burkholderiaceae bacterium]
MSVTAPNAEALYLKLREAVRAWLAAQPDPAHLVGIASGGAWLARRLQTDLGLPGEPGVISSVMHRDDFAQRGLAAAAMQTKLPFEVSDARVLLVDDVLYTGRTIRAVLNELFDYGRPASVALAVLVDRGGRELPVCADLCAAQLSVPAQQVL